MPHIEGGPANRPHINRAPDQKPHFDRWANGSTVSLTPYKLGPPGGPGPAGADGAPGGSDAAFAAWVADDTSATAGEIAARYAHRGSGFLPKLGGRITAWDDFHRSDRTLTGHALTASGHTYTYSGAGATPEIVDHRYRPVTLTGEANILYTTVASLDGVAAKVVFTPGTTGFQNAVVGSCTQHFGGTGGSIQLAIYGPDGKSGSSPRQDWLLFYVEQPINEPYPEIASGQFSAADRVKDDGTTVYEFAMRRTGTTEVTVDLPNGATFTFDDPAVDLYWGDVAGIQCRRGVGGVDDGSVEFLAHAETSTPPTSSASALPIPPYASQLRFDGQTGNSFSTPDPAWTPGDLDLRGYVAPDDWSPAAFTSVLSQWGTGAQSFYFGHQLSGSLSLGISLDGTTSSSQNSSVSTAFVDGRPGWVRVTYRASDGQTIFYTSTDGVTWTQLGSTRTIGSGGAPFDSGAAIQVGSRDGGQRYIGRVGFAEVRDGIAGSVVVGVDFRGQWTGVGTAGNTWTAQGAGLSWIIAEDSVPNLKTDLASLPGGVALTGTPSTGQVPTATSGTAATWQSPAGALPVSQLKTTQTLTNTSTETTVFTATTIAAGSLDATKTTFRLHIAGNLDNIATPGTFVGHIKVNGTDISGSFTLSPSVTGAQTGILWDVAGDLYVDVTGVSGSCTFLGTAANVTSTAGARNDTPVQGVGVTVDLSGGLTVTVTLKMQTANAGNIMRAFRGTLVQVA